MPGRQRAPLEDASATIEAPRLPVWVFIAPIAAHALLIAYVVRVAVVSPPDGFVWPDLILEGLTCAAVTVALCYLVRLRIRELTVGWILILLGLDADFFTEVRPILAIDYAEEVLLVVGFPIVALGFFHSQRLLRERLRLSREVFAASRQSEQMRVEKDAAEKANRTKSEFLANMSHELRTPLVAVLGFADLLEDDAQERGDLEAVDSLSRIRAAGGQLLSLIGDILDLARIEAGRSEVSPSTFELGPVLAQVVSIVQPIADARGNQMSVRGLPSGSKMHTDEQKLRQVLLNLLSNACKFTEDGRVTLDVHESSRDGRRRTIFRVLDTGIGMSAEELRRCGQPFWQADTSSSRGFSGSGLGLSLSRRFCELMGGSLSLTSTSGVGTTVTVEIPSQAGARRTDPAGESAPAVASLQEV